MKNDNIKMLVHYHFSKDSRTKSISLLTVTMNTRFGSRDATRRRANELLKDVIVLVLLKETGEEFLKFVRASRRVVQSVIYNV